MFTVPDLPYDYAALEPYIDAETMHVHHDKHHAAYVKNLSDALAGKSDWFAMSAEDILRKLDSVPDELRTKVRNNAGGHANHSLFWSIMAPEGKGGGGEPSGELGSAITAVFGTYATFQAGLAAAAIGRFGSGWAWLSLDGGKLIIEDTANQDSPLSAGHTPILGLDVWEHAYYLKYQNRRADYIAAWWKVVNWKEVEKRFTQGK